jgi:hypothetical protein
MTFEEEKAFRAAFNVRPVERCCGTCRHFERNYECAGCANPKQAEFDTVEQMAKTIPGHIPEDYGAYGGIEVDEGMVCDLWEQELNKEEK